MSKRIEIKIRDVHAVFKDELFTIVLFKSKFFAREDARKIEKRDTKRLKSGLCQIKKSK